MNENERLRVLDAIQRLLAELQSLRSKSPPGFARLWHHILESAESAALNVSEAIGDGRVGKKVNFFRIGCGSIGECAGGLRSLVAEGGAKRSDTFKSMDLCVCISRMLKNLADYWDAQPRSTPDAVEPRR
jgi:four helix bundle protein